MSETCFIFFSDTYYLRNVSAIRTLLIDVPLSQLRALSLSAITYGQLCYSALNLTDVFGSLHMQNLEYLDLSKNSIYVIYGSVTATWPKLRILDLSQNMLFNSNDMSLVFDIFVLHPAIEILNLQIQNKGDNKGFDDPDMTSIHKRQISMDIVSDCMEKHDIDINDILGDLSAINETTACEFGKCVGRNTRTFPLIIYFPCSIFPVILKKITDYIHYSGIPYNNSKVKILITKSLKEIYLDHVYTIQHNSYQDRIVHLDFDHSNLRNISMASSTSFLKGLLWDTDISKHFWITGVENMRTFDMSDNQLHVCLCDKFLKSFTNITLLNLQRNFVTFRPNDTIVSYFPKLEYLNIAFNNLTSDQIPYNLFQNSNSLQTINLAGNHMGTFKINLVGLNHLTTLNMSNTKLTKFEIQTITYLKNTKPSILRIDLQNNILGCSCSQEEIAMIELIQNADKFDLHFINSDLYTCYDESSYRLLVDVNIAKHTISCRYKHLDLILGTTISNFLLLLVLVLTFVGYKYRFRLLTNYLRLKNRLGRKDTANADFTYDAYISYCANDRFWVHGTLMETLEVKYGFKLCIHYRDFIPGRDIVDEIVSSIEHSRVLIIILSEESLKSSWCDYELKTAHAHAVQKNKEFLVIKLGKIKMEHIDPEQAFVKGLLESRVYITWPEEWRDRNQNNEDIVHISMKREIEDRKLHFWIQITNVLYGREVSCRWWSWRRIGARILQAVSRTEEMNHAELISNGTRVRLNSDERTMLI